MRKRRDRRAATPVRALREDLPPEAAPPQEAVKPEGDPPPEPEPAEAPCCDVRLRIDPF